MHPSDNSPDPRRGKKSRRRARYRLARTMALACLLIISILLILDFIRFAESVQESQPEPVTQSDAIVVLTGGRDRVEKALMLLSQGRAERLLISGVHPSTSLNTLLNLSNADPALADRIDLDYLANDTIGNANEAAKWIRSHRYDRIILVTSNYHMPRSLIEFRTELPDVAIQAYAITRTDLEFDQWYLDLGKSRLLVAEFAKYFAARLRTAL